MTFAEIRKLPGPPSPLSGILDALGDDILCDVFELLDPHDLNALAQTWCVRRVLDGRLISAAVGPPSASWAPIDGSSTTP